jgi:hypothetical protein
MPIDRMTADVPDSAEELILDLYRRMPPVRIAEVVRSAIQPRSRSLYPSRRRTSQSQPCID